MINSWKIINNCPYKHHVDWKTQVRINEYLQWLTSKKTTVEKCIETCKLYTSVVESFYSIHMKPEPGEGRGSTTKNCELNSGILGLGFWSFYFWGFQLGFPVDNFFFLVRFRRRLGSTGPFFPKKKKKAFKNENSKFTGIWNCFRAFVSFLNLESQ